MDMEKERVNRDTNINAEISTLGGQTEMNVKTEMVRPDASTPLAKVDHSERNLPSNGCAGITRRCTLAV